MNLSPEEFRAAVMTESSSLIFITLLLHDSLNLKELAAITNKLETTTLHQVKKLLKMGIIEIDSVKSASRRGKFYKVSDEAKDEFRKIIQGGQRSLAETQETLDLEESYKVLFRKMKEADFEGVLLSSETIAKVSQSVQNISLQNLNLLLEEVQEFEGDEEDFVAWCKQRKLPLGEFSMMATNLPIKRKVHLKAVMEEVTRFQQRMIELREEFNKDEPEEGFEQIDQFIYLFSSSINKPLFEDTDLL